MSMLSEMGINIIEDEEAEDDDKGATDLVEASNVARSRCLDDRDREA